MSRPICGAIIIYDTRAVALQVATRHVCRAFPALVFDAGEMCQRGSEVAPSWGPCN